MNIQQLRAQIVALQDATMDENKNFRSSYDEGKFDALSVVDALLDSLQEEPVSDDLEEASKRCSSCIYLEEVLSDDDKEVLKERLINTFKAGAKWQKEQITAKAIDGEVGYWNQRGLSILMKLPRELNDEDKCKVIIIKSE